MHSGSGSGSGGTIHSGPGRRGQVVDIGIIPRKEAIQQHRRLNPPSSTLPSVQSSTGHAISPRLDTDGDERDDIDVTIVFNDFLELPMLYAQMAARLRKASPSQAGDLIATVNKRLLALIGD